MRPSRYGNIPLVKVTVRAIDGRFYDSWEPSPSFRPKMPPGAVPGNIHAQVFCSHCHVPKYYHVDEQRKCVQCDDRFTFKATEQKYWYETLKFHFDSVPVRCVTCRKQRRTAKALRQAIADAKDAIESAPGDPGGYLALARSLVMLRERAGAGDINQAIAAARRAAALWPKSPEPLFWEGSAHLLAGRSKKGQDRLGAFLEASRKASVTAGLIPEARRKLARLSDVVRRAEDLNTEIRAKGVLVEVLTATLS